MGTFVDQLLSKPAEYKPPVRAATAIPLPPNTRSGITLIANNVGALPDQDGVSMRVGDRLLVWRESDQVKHGTYFILDMGSPTTRWALQRGPDMDSASEATVGALVPIIDGALFGGRMATLSTREPAVGVTPLVFRVGEYQDVNVSHINTNGEASPEMVPKTALGVGGQASVNGTDGAGTVSFLRGVGCTAGLIATMTLHREYDAEPTCTFNGVNDAAVRSNAGYKAKAIGTKTIGWYNVDVSSAEDGQTQDFTYQLMGGGPAPSAGAIILFRDYATVAGFFGTAFVVPRPTNYALNDLLIARLLISPGTNASAFTVTPPAGWTQRIRTEFDNNGASQIIFTKKATGSEPADYTFTMGAPVSCDADVLAYSGAHGTTPWVTFSAAEGDSQTAIAPSLTAVDNNSLLLHWVAGSITERNAIPFGLINRAAYGTVLYTDDKTVNAGATGAKETTFLSSQAWVAQMALIKPQPL